MGHLRIIFISSGSHREREGDRDIQWFTPQKPSTATLGQAKIKSLELSLGLSCCWQGLKYLRYRLLPLKVHISRKLESAFGSRHSTMACRHPKWWCKCYIKHPFIGHLKPCYSQCFRYCSVRGMVETGDTSNRKLLTPSSGVHLYDLYRMGRRFIIAHDCKWMNNC